MTTKERIAVFLPNLAGGGAENAMVKLVGGLAERGFCTDLVLAKAAGPYLDKVSPSVRIVDLDCEQTLRSLPRLLKYLRAERPTVLLSALDHANIVALLARRLSGMRIRASVCVQNTLSVEARESGSRRQKLVARLVQYIYPWADSVIGVSEGVADDLVQFAHLDRGLVHVIYNPIVSEQLLRQRSMPVEHPWLAAKDKPLIISVGRLNPQKSYDVLLRAFAQLRTRVDARLIILGDGEERASLEQLAESLGIADDVDLPGFAVNPFAYVANADVFVLSSRFEGLPTVLIEALACGVPVVSTDCPSGPREILRDGSFGALIPVGDVPALAQALETTLSGGGIIPPPESWQPYRIEAAISKYVELLTGCVDEHGAVAEVALTNGGKH